ncbi:uncharacterized protein [Amphiura filiformis]|uniref:uncharacterized protein n=1 Tax=Amphiura filiformis TaxID=82378 RepID=UPI003B20E126
MVINFQSIRGKTAELNVSLEVDNPDVLIGCETWIDDTVSSSEIFPNSYTVFRKDRITTKPGYMRGGVMIAVKSTFTCSQRLDLDTNCEIVWIEISITGTKPVLVGSYYRPPSSNRDYLSNFRDSLAKINMSQFSNIWLAGDFNLGDVLWENQTKPRKVYLFNKANTTELKNEAQVISNELIDRIDCDGLEVDVNGLWNEFKVNLSSAVDKHVPAKMVRKRQSTPWISHNLKRLHKRKQRAYNRAKKTGTQEDWEKFRQLRKQIKKASRKAYKNYINNKCLDSNKQLWSFMKTLKKESTGIPALLDSNTGDLVVDSKTKVELLNIQYQKQFTQERLNDIKVESESNIPDMPDIIIREDGVVKLLTGLSPFKAAGPDEMTPWVLKTTDHEISPFHTKMFQLSLDTGVVPQDWLCANITPIFKKGDKSKPSNYRSVNLTSVCSKVLNTYSIQI